MGNNTILTIVALVFVLSVLTLVVYALFAMSPFAHHGEVFHDPGVRQDSPHLE